MNVRSLLAQGAVALMLASGAAVVGSTVAATPAGAAGSCAKANAGKTRVVFGVVRRTFVIADAKRIEVARGTTGSRSVTFGSQKSKTNEVRVSASASASFKAGIFGKAEVTVGGEWGRHTTTSTHYQETTTWNFNKPGVYYVSRGFETFNVAWSAQRCRRPHIGAGPNEYAWMQYNSGRAIGFGTVDGTVRCADSYGGGTYRAFVKARRC
jgi:hypothetical protein